MLVDIATIFSMVFGTLFAVLVGYVVFSEGDEESSKPRIILDTKIPKRSENSDPHRKHINN